MTTLWHDADKTPATDRDADCEGKVWVWREMFVPGLGGRLVSDGFHLERATWREVGIGRSDRKGALWCYSNLTKPRIPQ